MYERVYVLCIYVCLNLFILYYIYYRKKTGNKIMDKILIKIFM